MLVLSRKVEQQIQIGDGIVITILQVKGNSVRIGIEAPRELRVLRSELEPKSDAAAPAAGEAQAVAPAMSSAASSNAKSTKSVSNVAVHNPRSTDERMFTIVRRTPEFAVAERSHPNERADDEATSQDLELRLSRRSTMSALRGCVMPRR